MTETSVPESEGERILRGQLSTLAEQVDGFRHQLQDLFDQLGVNDQASAEFVIEILQESVGLARNFSTVYLRDPQDAASIQAALLLLVDNVS